MLDVATIVGSIVGIIGGVAGVVSSVNQHRQTRIMEIGLERAIEAPEGDTGTGIESKFTALVNKRLSDTRRNLRDEYRPRLERIEATLHERQSMDMGSQTIIRNLSESLRDGKTISDIAEEARRIRGEIAAAQERILAESGRYSTDIAALGREVEGLQQQIEDMRNGIGYHDLVRMQIRLIGEQLLRMTSQDRTMSQE